MNQYRWIDSSPAPLSFPAQIALVLDADAQDVTLVWDDGPDETKRIVDVQIRQKWRPQKDAWATLEAAGLPVQGYDEAAATWSNEEHVLPLEPVRVARGELERLRRIDRTARAFADAVAARSVSVSTCGLADDEGQGIDFANLCTALSAYPPHAATVAVVEGELGRAHAARDAAIAKASQANAELKRVRDEMSKLVIETGLYVAKFTRAAQAAIDIYVEAKRVTSLQPPMHPTRKERQETSRRLRENLTSLWRVANQSVHHLSQIGALDITRSSIRRPTSALPLKLELKVVDAASAALDERRADIYRASIAAPKEDKICGDGLAELLGQRGQSMRFPIEVTGITQSGDTNIMGRSMMGHQPGAWVSVRPCAAGYEDKTFLGIFLGDLPMGCNASWNRKTGVLEVMMGSHNPAIWVPKLGKVIWGAESFWGEIEGPEGLRKITDEDINATWYARAARDLSWTTFPPAAEASAAPKASPVEGPLTGIIDAWRTVAAPGREVVYLFEPDPDANPPMEPVRLNLRDCRAEMVHGAMRVFQISAEPGQLLDLTEAVKHGFVWEE